MRRSIAVIGLAGLLACGVSSISAGSIISYPQWRAMPDDIRVGFVLGGYDAFGGVIHGDDPYLEANVRGVAACGPGIGLSAAMMVRMIDVYYDAHPEARVEMAAVAALHMSLLDVCKDYVNAARFEARLNLLR